MSEKLSIIETPELKSLGTEKSQQITKTFEPMVKMLEGFESSFNELVELSKESIDKDLCAKAKRLRLDIGRVRIDTGKLKDKQKEYIKLEDKAIMGVHNIVVWAVKEKEDILRSIENHFAIKEAEKLDKIKVDRENWLMKNTDVDIETLSIDLRNMDKDVWKAYAQSKKQECTDRVQAENEAEKKRIEDEKARIAEEKRIKAENERLKKEADERERLAEIEQDRLDKIEADRVKAEEKKREEQIAETARIKKIADDKVKVAEKKAESDRVESARLAKIEKDKADKVQAELDAKKEAEKQEKDRIEAEKEALRKAGDKGALTAIRGAIATIIDSIDDTNFKSKSSAQTANVVKELLNEAWTKL